MAADLEQPTISNTHVNVLPQIVDNQTSLARMFSDGGEANVPLRSVRFLNNTMYLWNGSTWEVAPIAIGGGGTGAETAAAARANLGTNVATNVTSGVFNADRIPTISISDKTSGTLDGTRVDQSTTGARGTVQLNNTLTSTSTTQALTAAQGKVLKDTAVQLNNTLTSTSTAQALTAAQGKVLKDTADSLANTVSGKQNQILSTTVEWNGSFYDAIGGYFFSRTSAGRLTITHNLGDSSAIFMATGLDPSVNISFNNRQSNSIVCYIDNVITNLAVDADFMLSSMST
tara:strand:- start:399 stop:1259 length:861 start_codon:yes stop_codon:yes gene_type:complete